METKYLIKVEFIYNKFHEDERISGYASKTVTIGTVDTLDEAIKLGNESLDVLSGRFEVRADDKFQKNFLWGSPKLLVTNCSYPTNGVQYFAKITPLKFEDLSDVIQETLTSSKKYKEWQNSEN